MLLALAVCVGAGLLIFQPRQSPLSQADLRDLGTVLGMTLPGEVYAVKTRISHESGMPTEMWVKLTFPPSELPSLMSQPLLQGLPACDRLNATIRPPDADWSDAYVLAPGDRLLCSADDPELLVLVRTWNGIGTIYVQKRVVDISAWPAGLLETLTRYPDRNSAIGPTPADAGREWP